MATIIPSKQTLRHLSRLCAWSSQPRASCLIDPRLSTIRQQTDELGPHRHPRLYTTSTNPTMTATSQTTSSSAAAASNFDTNASTPPTPDITDHYTLFPTTLPSGPPPSGPFHISLPSLRKEFLTHQSRHHPDKAPPGSPRHKQNVALSTLLNQAYKTLSDPLLRAQYILHTMYGIDVTSEDNAAHPTDQTTLMEVMEVQEAVEEASGQAEVDNLTHENQARIEETIRSMAKAFEDGDGDTAKDECIRLKYWTSLQDGLNDWEPGKEVRLIH